MATEKTAAKDTGSAAGRELDCVRITPAANGYVVTKSYRPKPGKGNTPPTWEPDEPAIFENLGNVLEYLRDCFVGRGRK